MRCQCGFNSFDHNLVCPKCHRDLTATRRLLNLDIPAPGVINFFPKIIFAAPLVPVEAAQAEEPLIEIEAADVFEADQPWAGSLAPAEATFVSPAHQAAMDQIKSTLTETGDLNPEAAVVPGEGGGADLSSPAGGLNLDEWDADN